MTRRVLLHVGTPKSGTSYLQDRLARNRAALLGAGLDYVSTRSGDHFEAALDVLGRSWGGAEEEARGEWDALVRTAAESEVDVLVSHEILAGATPEAVERAVGSFPDDEVHVVLTLRDLGRQVPAEWQENVKHRSTTSYADFLERARRRYDDDGSGRFWRVQHVPHVLAAWSTQVPAERVHVVTVPPSGAPRDLLWRRFALALGVPESAAPAESTRTNASLGAAEVTVLRMLNAVLPPSELPRDAYVDWVREGLVRQVLPDDRGSQPATVPPRLRGWVDEVAREWNAHLRESRHDVVGDLDDLLPRWPDDDPDRGAGWHDPDRPDPDVTARAAVDALAWVVRRASAVPDAPSPVPPTPQPLPWQQRVTRAWRELRPS